MTHLNSHDGTKIWYSYHQNKLPCLVFIHGWGVDWTNWKKESAYLQNLGYSTLLMDLRGHGQSGKPDEKEKYDLSCFAKDIKAILEAEKITDFVLIGHSMGGMISLVYEKLFPQESAGFILCSTTANSIANYSKEKFMIPFIKHVADFIISHEHIHQEHFNHLKDIDITKYADAPDIEIFFKGLHNTPMKSVIACFEAMLDYSAEDIVKQIQVPTLIIEGEKDKLLPAINSIHLFEEISNAEIDFIPKGRHFVTLEFPELMDKYINSFLTRHDLVPK